MPDIKKVKRSNRYYGRYLYSLELYVPGAFYLRPMDHTRIDFQINYYNQWRTGGRLNLENCDAIHGYCDLLLSLKSPFKTVIYSDFIYIYTSDLQDLNSLIDSPLTQPHRINQITEVDLVYDKNFVYLKNPKYSHRSYLKRRSMSPTTVQALKSFFEINQDNINPNPRLNYILNFYSPHTVNSQRFMHNSDFVDHNNGHELLMLNIILPDIVKQTLSIKAK